MVTDYERQAIVDDDNLRLLAIGYWVMGGVVGLYGLLVVAYLALIGTVFAIIPASGPDAPPEALRWIFLGIAVGTLVVVGAVATLQIMTGFWLTQRRHRGVTMVVAALTCLSIPFGTFLGVLSLIVLARPSVKSLFEGLPAMPPAAPPMAYETPGSAG